MANDVRSGTLQPGQVPGQIAGQQVQTLQEKEQAKALLQQQQPLGKISAQDAARLAQQAGFQRTRKKSGQAFDVGDSAHAPIPIPDEEDTDNDSPPELLEEAQQHLFLASAQLGEVANAPSAQSLAETIMGSSFLPTEEGVKKLQDLDDRPAAEPLAFAEVGSSVKNLFNIELSDDLPMGHKMLVTGLLVAGEGLCVEVGEGRINERKLASGLQKIAERSNQAVGEAQKMNKGVHRELNLQRTFVFKR